MAVAGGETDGEAGGRRPQVNLSPQGHRPPPQVACGQQAHSTVAAVEVSL